MSTESNFPVLYGRPVTNTRELRDVLVAVMADGFPNKPESRSIESISLSIQQRFSSDGTQKRTRKIGWPTNGLGSPLVRYFSEAAATTLLSGIVAPATLCRSCYIGELMTAEIKPFRGAKDLIALVDEWSTKAAGHHVRIVATPARSLAYG
jgi:hypothetical protein